MEKSLPASGSRLGIAMRAISEPGYAERMRGWFAPFTVAERARLVGRPAVRSGLDPYLRGEGDPLRRMLYADVHTSLTNNLLERGDRMSMAASLELRPLPGSPLGGTRVRTAKQREGARWDNEMGG